MLFRSSQAPWSASILALLLLPTLAAQTAAPAHWAFQPVGRPTIPEVPLASRNPIDAFVAARLRDKGLHLAPEADRATLIRRLYFVMLGVPPTPEAVAQFAADPDLFARAKAEFDRVKADIASLRRENDRYQMVLTTADGKTKAIALAEYDLALSLSKSTAAELERAQQAVSEAKVVFDYATLRSPINGAWLVDCGRRPMA